MYSLVRKGRIFQLCHQYVHTDFSAEVQEGRAKESLDDRVKQHVNSASCLVLCVDGHQHVGV